MRRLIVNADDFGLTRGVNQAIVESHENGVLTSATLMANGQAFEEAVRLAKTHPRLSVGCHVSLVDGMSLLDGSKLSSLTGKAAPDGDSSQFPESLNTVALRAVTGRLDDSEIEAEATAQIRKLQAAEIVVSHLDTHKHTHMFPQILRPLLGAAQTCGVLAIRNPFERLRASAWVGHPKLWKRSFQVTALSALAIKFRRTVAEAGLATPDGSVGVAATGVWNENFFRSLAENMPEGTWELVCHPGYDDAQLRGTKTRLLASRAEELRILTSPLSRELLERNQVQLISFRELVNGPTA